MNHVNNACLNGIGTLTGKAFGTSSAPTSLTQCAHPPAGIARTRGPFVRLQAAALPA